MSRHWSRVCHAAGAAGLALFLVIGFTPLVTPFHRWMSTAPGAEGADAIVVLGASVSRTASSTSPPCDGR